MTEPSSDPSVSGEPHLRTKRNLDQARKRRADGEQVRHSVWDEPGISPELAGPVPADALTYGNWLEQRRAETSTAASWGITLGLALLAGPWAVVGAVLGSGQTPFSLMALVLFGPVAEELMKIAAGLYVVERKPFLFTSPVQIITCALAGGLVFASIENILYLHVYVRDVPAWLPRWRWTVCVGLHVGCSAIAGLGVLRVWRDSWARHAPARISLAFPYLITAVAVHGLYNGLAALLSLLEHRL